MTIDLHGIIQMGDLIFEGLWEQIELLLIKRKGNIERNRQKCKDRR